MASWWRSSPELRAREVALAGLAGVVLAVLMFWPLVLHLGQDIPLDLGDPLSQTWQVAWDGHALAEQPFDLFQSNQFWPLRDSLAFSDALIGYAPAGLIGEGPTAAVARYDVLWLLAFALAFLGAYLLARELGLGPWAAAVAGVAFAFTPWRLEQGGHLHVLSSGGIPLTLFLLLRGWRRERAGLIVGGFAIAAWQVSLGFSLGLQLLYLLAALALVAGVWWLRSGRPPLPRRVLVATAAGVVLLAGVSLLLARPYVRVLDDHPEAKRSAVTVSRYSGPPRMFLTAPETSLVWGRATRGLRDGLTAVPEKTLFPGLLVIALALAGLGWGGWPRSLRIGLGLAVLVLAILSLGFQQHGVGRFLPYRLLYEIVPGWQGIRVPGRLHTLTTLGLALLAAAGTARAGAALARRPRRGPLLAAGCGAVLVLGVLVEGAGFGLGRGGEAVAGYPHPSAPAAPAGLRGLPAPLLQLPAAPDDNRRYLLWSTDGFPKLVNGRSSFEPRFFARVIREARCFPDAPSIAFLRGAGVRTVAVHTDLPGAARPRNCGPPRAATGSGVRGERRGRLLVYRLGR
jgi:hypothetical protein